MKNFYLICIGIFFSNILLAQSTVGVEKDNPGGARQHDFDITKDPVTNDIPTQRLLPIIDSVTQHFNNNPGTKTVSTWVERGPNNVGGRTRTLMFDPNDGTSKKVWAGGVNGGLWFTNDITIATPTWTAVDNFWVNMAVSCIAYAPNNIQTFYVGTGEGYGNSDAARGSGIWKTSNGGSTWTQLASTHNNESFAYVQKIVVTSTGVVLAATRGRFCNSGSGIMRSTDGGATWTRVLGNSGADCATSSASSADIEMAADGTLFSSMGIGYTGDVFISTNAGSTWTSIGGNGFPASGYERIELAVAPSNSNRIYAMVENSSNGSLLGIYTSANKGGTWTACTQPSWYDQNCSTPSTDMTRTQGWYDLILTVDPLNENTVYAGGVDVMKSSNTGSTWTQLCSWWGGCGRQYVHADQHAMIFKPGSSDIALLGNDGGIYYSTNLTTATPTFSGKNQGYNVTQFYSCAIKPSCKDEYILGGTQDNGTHRFLNAGMNSTNSVFGGDGAFCFIDQNDPSFQIVSYVYNNFYLTTNDFGSTTQILSSDNTIGRFINPADYDDVNNILFTGYSTTQLSRVSGITTTPVSAQITVTGMSSKPTHVRVSPHAPIGTSTVYVGTSNGRLYKVTDAHASPTTVELTGSASPWATSASISCVEIGATENDLLVTFSNYGVVSVWRSTDGGASWSNKEGGLPDMPVRWAIYNPNDLNEVYVGTELGVYSTTNITAASPTWVANNNGLANTRVDMFQLRKSDNLLVAATHGRGMFTSNSFGGGSAAPVAEFTANATTICQGSQVTFNDESCGSISSWSWVFQGGTPATSSLQNPTVTYNTVGTYSVTLTANNSFGNHVLSKTSFITVTSPPVTAATASLSTICPTQSTTLTATTSGPQTALSYTAPGTTNNAANDHITLVQFNTINNTSVAGGVNGYVDYTGTVAATTVSAGLSYNLTVNVFNGGTEYAAAWFDWNRNGQYETTEFVDVPLTLSGTYNGTVSVLVPSNSAAGVIRVRVRSKYNSVLLSSDFASAYTYGETEDYLINVIPQSTYLWMPGSISGSPANATPSSTTTYTVTSTAANGCVSTATTAVTVSSVVANAGVDKTLTCTTPSSTIGTASVAGHTYAWSPATGLSSATAAQPIASSTTTTTYTLTVTNTANGCTATDVVLVTVNKTLPTANAGVDKTLTCTTPSSSIGSASVAGNTYSWSPATALSSATAAQPTATSTSTTTYTLTVTTTANGCTATDAVLVSVNKTLPTANAGVDKTLTCTTPSSSIGSASVAGNTYSWSPATALSSATAAQPTATSTSTTTYTLTVTTTANGCTATDAVLVSVNKTLPTANAGADQNLTCTTPSSAIGTASVVGNTYSWSPATALSSATAAQPTATSTSTTTYTITVTTTANGCTATDAVLVSVNKTLPTANAGADQSLTCTTPSSAIGTASVVGNTYSWSPTTALSSATAAQPTATSTTTTTYTLTVTTTANGCAATDAVLVSVNKTLPTANAGADQSLTCTTPSSAIGTASIVGNTYSWSPATALSSATAAQPTATSTSTTTYTITVTTTANGCTATDAVLVSVNKTLPTANAGADQSLTCTTPSSAIGTASVVGNTYSWSPTTALSSATAAQPTATSTSTTTYTLTVTTTANGCTATDAVLVSVNKTLPTANAGADQSLTCTTPSSAIGTASVVGNTYSWSPATALSSVTAAQPTATSTFTITYTLTVTTTANGCTATDDVLVTVNKTLPTANAGVNQLLTCTTPSSTIGSTSVAGNTYSWSPSTALSSATAAQPTATSTTTTTYTLTVTTTANGCTATDDVLVTVNKTLPTANAGIDRTLTCAVPTATIGSASVAGNTYSWSPVTALSSATIAQPIASSSTTTTYTLTVTTTANGCTATDAVLVTVVPCNSTLTTKLFLEGFYAGSSLMLPALLNQGVAGASTGVADSIMVELRNASWPYLLHASIKTLLETNGTATCVFPSTSGNYYIAVKHRNSIETWSAAPVAISTSTNYDFSNAANKAYGSNQKQMEPGVFAFYSGDITQDGSVDAADYILLDPDVIIGNSGYILTDLTGDGFVDALDYIILDSNIIAGIGSAAP